MRTATGRRFIPAVLSALVVPASAAAQPIELSLPIACEIGGTCVIQNYVDRDRSPAARDYRCGTLTYDKHNGTDFRLITTALMRAGVNVLAAASGRVLRMRSEMPDVSIRDPGAPSVVGRECGNGVLIEHDGNWQTQYCHMAQHSMLVKVGDRVSAGQPIGRVGLSGHTEFPHLHLTVRHRNSVVDPFAFGAPDDACGGGTSLWRDSIRNALAYRERSVINTGFAPGPVTMAQIEQDTAGKVALTADAPALVAFVRAIGLRAGDVQRIEVTAPDGVRLVDRTEPPLDRSKAQVMLFAGKRAPTGRWPKGQYRARYSVSANGKVVLESSFATAF